MMLPLGAKAPSFELKDTSGRAWSRAGFDGSPALLVAFICNHCPFVKHVRAGFASLAAEYQKRGVTMVAIASNDAKAYYNRGTAQLGLDNFTEAVSDLTRSIEFEPKAADSYFNRGLAYRLQRMNKEAIEDFSKAIALFPDKWAYYYERCNARIVTEDYDGAIADGSEMVRLFPKEAESFFMRGLASYLKGDLNAGLADAEKALKAGHLCVELNGGRMRDKQTILDEFETHIPLPDYFGGNWDALEECLTDPGVLGKKKGCLLIIHGADLVAESSPEEYEELLDILLETSRHWLGQRPPFPFKTALISEGPPKRSDDR